MSSSDSPANWLSMVPPGQFATRQWLLDQGASVHTLDNALKSRKLVALARGVVARPEVPVGREGVLASMNRALADPVWLGGLSALAEMGLTHYLDGSGRVHLYSPGVKPSWLPRLPLDLDLQWHGTARLWDMRQLMAAGSLREQALDMGGWLLASPEQAFLEALMDVPKAMSFEHADNLMQGLSSLSPKRLEALLKACRHVQVKRLFFFFADRYDYPWRKRLNPDDYDLGSGKRHIVAGGVLDSTYLITVPEVFHGQS